MYMYVYTNTVRILYVHTVCISLCIIWDIHFSEVKVSLSDETNEGLATLLDGVAMVLTLVLPVVVITSAFDTDTVSALFISIISSIQSVKWYT